MADVYKGDTGEIEVGQEALVIRRFGVQARLQFGKTPDRTIPLRAIRTVLFKEPSMMSPGALRLVLGTEIAPGEAKARLDDHDTMTFTAQRADAFRALYQWLTSVAAKNQADQVNFATVDYDRGSSSKSRAQESKFAALGVREDIAAAAGRMGWTLGGKREIKKLAEHVPLEEVVTFIAQGTYANDEGIVVLTDRRLLFVFHGLVRQALEDFPLDRLSSVHTKAGMITGDLTVHASGNRAVITRIVKADLKHLADALRARINVGSGPIQVTDAPLQAAGTPDGASLPSAPAADTLEQLRRLGELRDLGVLTDEEFSAKKAELLARL